MDKNNNSVRIKFVISKIKGRPLRTFFYDKLGREIDLKDYVLDPILTWARKIIRN